MEDVQILKIGEKSYQIKDETARTTANSAETKARNAEQTANTASKNATSALNKINNIKLEGTYTSESETLTLSISTESTE